MEAYERAHKDYSTAADEDDVDDDITQPRDRECVVHVEDDEDLRTLCGEILDEADFDVLSCATLMAGRIAIQARVPDVLLIDQDLPDGSGLDLVRWVRSIPAYARVQIVVFSARKKRVDVERALAAGCDAFLGKPCSPEMLVEAIETMLRPAPESGPKLTAQRRSVPAL
jgi:DNA-binding response OmpR family regulator